MAASIRRTGSSDYGHVGVVCDECTDASGRPWQIWYSRRTTEGRRLAERDRDGHNRARHATGHAEAPQGEGAAEGPLPAGAVIPSTGRRADEALGEYVARKGFLRRD
jgi:hypothetical protein